MAAHIAERALELDAEAPVEPKAESMVDLPLMANLVRAMLHRALDAFVREDADLALDVCRSDDAVDELHSQLFRALLTFMREDPTTIARTMRGVRSSVPVFRSMTLDTYMGEALAVEHLATALVSTCGAMALVLALVGVYGVMAFAVVRRRLEIGVRLALGARPRQIIRLVFAEGLRLTAIGVAIGLAIGAALPLTLSFFLFDVGALDGLSLLVAPPALALVATLAAIAPVRRALGVDPMIVLRQQ